MCQEIAIGDEAPGIVLAAGDIADLSKPGNEVLDGLEFEKRLSTVPVGGQDLSTADLLLGEIEQRIIIVDFHAEATSEKIAFSYYADGRASAVIGTHTHVQTADEKILPGGTACITDVGMTGPHDGIIGMQKESVLNKFLTCMPTRFDELSSHTNGAFVAVDGGFLLA